MSVYCTNIIQVIGAKELISQMFELVKSDARDLDKIPDSTMSKGEVEKFLALEFDFNKVVPYPEEFAKMDKEHEEKYGFPNIDLLNNRYAREADNWRVKFWGTDFNATSASTQFIDSKEIVEVENFKLSDYQNPSCAEIHYTTSTPAFPVTEALSKQFPDLLFKHFYKSDEFPEVGYQVRKAGNLLSEWIDY